MFKDYYDGCIKSVRWNTDGANQQSGLRQNMWSYTYDWKQQLTSATFGTYQKNNTTNSFGAETIYPDNGGLVPGKFYASNDYKLHGITYDRNGNILTLKWNDKNGVLMDELSYTYEANTNKLRHVLDAVGFKGYDDVHAQIQDNYQYSETGEVTLDKEKQIKITYHVNGKVEYIHDEQTNTLKVAYTYNERGEKITKTEYNNSVAVKTIHYVREISGTVISIYEEDSKGDLQQEQVPIPGIGAYYTDMNQFVYQLTDHLGNVRATISDTKVNGEAEVLSYADYYPFGMQMAGRNSASSPQYRLAYQGQELDTEMGGSGFYSFSLRHYDPRLGKWLSPDPYQQHWSPYLAMSNNPVSFVDPDGGWSYSRTYEWYGGGNGPATVVSGEFDGWEDRVGREHGMTLLVDGEEVSGLELGNMFGSGNWEYFSLYGDAFEGKSFGDLGMFEPVFMDIKVHTYIDGPIDFTVFIGYKLNLNSIDNFENEDGTPLKFPVPFTFEVHKRWAVDLNGFQKRDQRQIVLSFYYDKEEEEYRMFNQIIGEYRSKKIGSQATWATSLSLSDRFTINRTCPSCGKGTKEADLIFTLGVSRKGMTVNLSASMGDDARALGGEVGWELIGAKEEFPVAFKLYQTGTDLLITYAKFDDEKAEYLPFYIPASSMKLMDKESKKTGFLVGEFNRRFVIGVNAEYKFYLTSIFQLDYINSKSILKVRNK